MNIATAQIDFKLSFADLMWPKTFRTDINNLLTDTETVASEPFFLPIAEFSYKGQQSHQF